MTAAMTTTLMHWFSPGAMQSLGWALLHFIWQGTALAALAAAAMALCRRASTRYLLGVGALALMLLAPLATFFFYSQQHSGVADTAKSSPLAAAWPTARDRDAASGSSAQHSSFARYFIGRSSIGQSSIAPSLDALPWLVEAWLLGVAFFSLRSAGGFLLLERERRKRSIVVGTRVLEICRTAARSAWPGPRDRLLRMQVAAGASRDRMVSSRRVLAGDRPYRPLRGTA